MANRMAGAENSQPPAQALAARADKLRLQMAGMNLDALLVSAMPNVFYLSGFTGSTAVLLVTDSDMHILVDPRYTVQARRECTASVHEFTGKPIEAAAAELLNEIHPRRVGYEASDLTVIGHRQLRAATEKSIRLRATTGILEQLRQIKDDYELSLIRTAAAIADSAFESVLMELQAGMSEKSVALLIDTTLRKMGADKEAFDTIAASGPNAACPHASPTDTIIRSGTLLKMDFGGRYNNYNSDITRTVCIGAPTRRQKDIYQIVKDAQSAAIDAVAPGVRGSDVDAVARNYIAAQGYASNFGHGLGHMIGIETHDGQAFSATSDAILQPGMVATVEPGIYIEGWGGIRIEDDILVTETGCEILTHAPRDFISIQG